MFGNDVAADIWPYTTTDEIHDAISVFIENRGYVS
jgi:hypothetical protein